MGEAEEPFGSTLRRMRQRAGLTQEELAERSGLSVKAISSLERGERQHPYPHTLRVLGTALDLGSQERIALKSGLRPRGYRVALPTPASVPIGREGEIQAVTDLLASGGTRLLTLTGPGGVGKTRLALAVAAGLAPRYTDGVVFVSLAPLRDAALVVPAIAQRLDLHQPGIAPLREAMHRFLSSRSILLVVDNLEHLPEAGVEVAAMLAMAPRLQVLATSRSPLRVQGEQMYPVLPLAPRLAAALFLERAAQAAPGAGGWDPSLLAEICRRLDGLPLAVERAAARTRILSPEALLDRLGQTLAILTRGARDLPERQQGLRQTIAWSHDLLDADEKLMFRRLAVFSGGWTLEAAAAVGQVDDATALGLNTELLDASLITREAGGGEPRFALLETVRAFAAEQLEESGEADLIRDRHAAYCHGLALSAGRQLWGPAQAQWLDRLESEHDNLGAALGWLLHRTAIEDVADISFALWIYWWIRGHLAEGQRWIEKAFARGGSLSPSGRAKLLFTAAFMVLPQGHYLQGKERLDEAERLARGGQDLQTLCWILTMRGYAAAVFRPAADAAATLAQAETLSRGLGNPHAASRAMVGRALVAFSAGQLAEADRILAACDAETRSLGVPWSLALVLSNRGRVLLELGEHTRAEALLRESIAILGELRDSGAITFAFTDLANAAQLRSDPQRAALLFGAADAALERNGAPLPDSHPFHPRLNQRCRADATAQLGTSAFEALRQQGRVMAISDAVVLAAGAEAGAEQERSGPDGEPRG